MIYLDNAATSGIKPPAVISAVGTALRKYNANPGRSGYKTAMDTAYKIYDIRTKIKDFFGADTEENVVFTPSCTYALNCVIKGANIGYGHIVVSDIEHNAVMRPVWKLTEDGKAYFTAAKTYPAEPEKTVQSFKNAIKNDTKLVVCTHASNVTGEINPIEKIGELCYEKGIAFAVDAAQSAGAIKIDMKKMHIDYLCIAAHKGLCAPMGTGILIARKPLADTIIEGGTGTSSLNFTQPQDMPERMESGTVNVPGILGVGAGVEYITQRGIDNAYNHEMRLAKYLYKNLTENKKIVLYTPFPEEYKFAPVIPFNVLGVPSEKTAQYLADKNIAVRGGLHCAPAAHKKLGTQNTGAVRVSIGSFNTKNDIDYLLNMLKFI